MGPRVFNGLHRTGRFLVRTSRVIMASSVVTGIVATVAWFRGAHDTFEIAGLIAILSSLTASGEQILVEWIHQALLKVSDNGLPSRS